MALAPAPVPDPAERRRPRRRLPARSQPRARLRPLRRPGARRRDGDRGPPRRRPRQLPADALLRARRGRADARDRVRRPAGRARVPRARPARPPRLGRARRRSGARDHARRRPEPADRPARLHGGAPEALRALRLGPARAARADRRPRPPGDRRRHGEARGLRPGARLPRDRALAQLEAADAPRAARPRRPGRLLDVLVHQLPADAAARPRLGRALPRRRADDRRRPLARVRVRARPVERARERPQARRPLPRRAGQRLRHLAVVAQPVLAGQVPDRQARPRALLPLRRGRLLGRRRTRSGRCSGADAPAASKLADESPHGQITPESYLGYERLDRNAGEPIEKDKPHAYTFPRGLSENELAYSGIWTVEDERAIGGLSAGLRLQYRARDVYLVLTGKGNGRRARRREARADGAGHATTGSTRSSSARGSATTCSSCTSRPGVAAYAFTFG